MRTITIGDDAYDLLKSLKQEGDSFTTVIRKHVHKPLETCGEIADWYESQPPPPINLDRLERYQKQRGRRSKR